MANNSPSSLLPLFLIFTVLLAVTQVTVAGRNIADKKQPDSFIGNDGNVLIPGIGRVQVPALRGVFPPYSGLGGGVGNTGGSTEGGSIPSYIPGGDDTFIPNPGVEVPSGIGGVPNPQTAHP
ncbi:hypothetical protein NE237_001345 [Protea cynaroides]|uniref:Cell wall protein n=1 Tax=Protea cynaroides TaxID=273540 RepID=A0A9Q0KTZ3_9MAGN|nr:hypothetical protein NE237_001345 [Protea cynaroides]